MSFLIPNRYTSTAVFEIAPAVLTEDPLASPPLVTPAAELLRQFEPKILSFQSLSMIIQDPHFNLYPGDIKEAYAMEDVVRNMLARDLHIAVLNGGSGAAFSISFSYSDRVKARDVVQRRSGNAPFNEEHLARDRANAPRIGR